MPCCSGSSNRIPDAGVDQALCLFGVPETVLADVAVQRTGAVTDDWFHLLLGYGKLRVILQAGSLIRAPGPRFELHGDQGSLIKHGLDPQAKMLEDGLDPATRAGDWSPRTVTPP